MWKEGKMKRNLFLAVLMLLLLGCHLNVLKAQLPTPIRNYTLDNGSAKEIVNRKDGMIHGLATPCPNRFGKENAAMRLGENAYISTPDFFDGFTYLDGFTISFWTKIEKNFSKRVAACPWEETDSVYRLFYGMNREQEVMLGFYHRRDRAVVDRYVLNKEADVANFGLWYWDPINFTDRQGWYEVFLVYRANSMTVYLMSPDGRMESALHYFGMQSFNQVTEWGLGGKSSPAQEIDDFKVYAQALTEEEVKTLFSREAVPNGMYTVTSAPNSNYRWMAENANVAVGTLIEVFAPSSSGNEFSMQWVFEPVPGKTNTCKIRMAYTDRYLASQENGSGAYVELAFEYGGNTEWLIEMTGDGYFFVRSAKNPLLYLKSVSRAFTSVRMLATNNYVGTDAPYYKWRLNLLKMHHDLVKDEFGKNVGYEVVENSNTVYGMVPKRPFTTKASPVIVDRDNYPSLSNHYKFQKQIDDSYAVYSTTYPTKALDPQSTQYAEGSAVELNEWRDGWETYYMFKAERPNPLGRKIRLVPVRAQTLSVYSGDYPTRDNIVFKKFGQGLEDGHYWQLYRDDGKLNRNKQISTIFPGLYKIKTMLPGGRCLHPQENSFTTGKDVVLGTFNDDRRTSFYWLVDYEKDSHGLPVRDGSYTIQLIGTDALLMGSTLATVPEYTLVQIVEMNRDCFASTKWFVEPARDGTGSFYVRSASGKLKYLHCKNGEEGALVEFAYQHSQLNQNEYKWIFERVTVPTPLEPGNYHIAAEPYYVHTTNNATSSETKLELGNLEQGGTFTWIVEQNDDFTYSIRLKDDTSKLIHTEAYRVDASAPLVIGTYDYKHAYSYRWLVRKTEFPDTYYLQLVGNPVDGYMHLDSHHLLYGTRLEIYRYVDVVDQVYRWKFEKVE